VALALAQDLEVHAAIELDPDYAEAFLSLDLPAVKADARPEDLVQPGHIFPLMAQSGGVLTRAGHTEAGCDLARLAGLEPAAAIVEILNEDGSMARRPDLEQFAREHGVRIGTIADLIRYRLAKEKFVDRIAEQPVTTAHGEFRLYCYDDRVNRTVHLALVKGEIGSATEPLVRVQIQDTLGDVIGVTSPRLGWPVADAIARIAREESGIVIVLRDHEEEQADEDDMLTLTTIHQAKGLEWDVVFILGLADGKFPHARSLEPVEKLEEERRLFYVAATRSKRYLELYVPLVTLTNGAPEICRPSRFVEELPAHVVEVQKASRVEELQPYLGTRASLSVEW
jgi:hypothetical protein